MGSPTSRDALLAGLPGCVDRGACPEETVAFYVGPFLLPGSISMLVLIDFRISYSRLELVPLTALSALVPTTFFLVVTSVVWREEYLATPANSDGGFSSGVFAILSPLDELYRRHAAEIQAAQGDAALVSPALAYLASFSRANLRSGLAQVGAAKGWASEAILRKGIGGASALVAFSGSSPRLAVSSISG